MDSLLNNAIFQQYGLSIAAAGALLFVAWTLWTLLSISFGKRVTSDLHPFETQRKTDLREGDAVFRWFEPLVGDVEFFMKLRKPERLTRLERSLIQAGESLPWKPTEYLATKSVEGALVALVIYGVVSFVQPTHIAIMAALATLAGYGYLAENSVHQKATARISKLRLRLPYAVDLVALMMQAGAGFQESIATFVDESHGHPLGDEFQQVLEQIELGRPQHEALEALNKRVCDDDVEELVFAINKGEELGTPISAILRDQAEQMRLKRSQWSEKAAAEAGVKVIFPGMLIVIACMFVVLAPFALPLLKALE